MQAPPSTFKALQNMPQPTFPDFPAQILPPGHTRCPPSPIPILDLDLSQSSHLKRSSPVWTSPQHPICLSHLYSHFFHEDFPGQTSLSGCWLPFVCTSCASNDGASGKLKWVWCIFILSAFVHCPAQSACVKLLLWTRHGNKCQV